MRCVAQSSIEQHRSRLWTRFTPSPRLTAHWSELAVTHDLLCCRIARDPVVSLPPPSFSPSLSLSAMDRATAQRLNTEMQTHLTALQEIGKKLQSLMPKRATLMSQQSENEMVKREFDLISDDDKVYKLNGPVLVKQDVSEAKVTIINRLKFFEAEMSDTSSTAHASDAAQARFAAGADPQLERNEWNAKRAPS